MDRQQVIDYITNANGVIVGQHIGAGSFYPTGWNTYAVALSNATSKWPALVGADFAWGEWSSSWLQCLIDHWNIGGLVEVSCHFANPFTGGSDTDMHVGNIADLWTPGNANYTRWHSILDVVVSRMLVLRNAGVVVIWRPLHECNGNWAWWENLSTTDYVSLWRDMQSYFNGKGLTNLVWLWSPASWYSDIKRPEIYYPGAAYVDLVGIDFYAYDYTLNDLPNGGYNALIGLGKPFVLGEFGPGSGGYEPNANSFDYGKLLDMMYSKCPLARGFMAWNTNYSIIKQNGASMLMNDVRAITRDKVNAPNTQYPTIPTATINANVSRCWWYWKVKLTWTTSNAVSASLDNNIGVVPLNGTKTLSVSRKSTKIYTITAVSLDGHVTKSSVTVII